MNLTEKESKVLLLILVGAIAAAAIAEQSELSVASVNAVINSLVKKELITKAEDGTIAPTDKGKEYLNTLKSPDSQTEHTQKNDSRPVTPTGAEGSNDPAREQSSNEGDPDVKVELQQKHFSGATFSIDENNPKDKEPITILIPYLKSEAAGEELRYALRTWEKNFKHSHRVVIIGDSEPWFSPEVVHIPLDPHLIKEDCACPAPSMIRNPQADITNKLFAAITAEELTGEIIYTNDDIFLLGATQMADLLTLKSFHEDLEVSGKRDNLYSHNNRITARQLKEHNLPTTRYGTHTPVVFIAEKLIELIEKHNALERGYPIESIYFNEVYPDARPIKVDGGANDPILGSACRHDISPEVLKKVFQTRKFINCDSKGWKAIEPFLKNLYPEPSRFEK